VTVGRTHDDSIYVQRASIASRGKNRSKFGEVKVKGIVHVFTTHSIIIIFRECCGRHRIRPVDSIFSIMLSRKSTFELGLQVHSAGGSWSGAYHASSSLYFATPLAFKSLDGGVPWNDLRKIFSEC